MNRPPCIVNNERMKPSTSFVLIGLVYPKTKCFFTVLAGIDASTIFERNVRNINAPFAFFRDVTHAKDLLVFRFFTNEFMKVLKRAGKNVTLSMLSDCVDGLFLPARSALFHLSGSLNGTFLCPAVCAA